MHTSNNTPRPRVVIVGAGFGGLRAAKGLANAPIDVVLVDRVNYHNFQPLLYQVATAGLEPDEIVHPVRDIIRHKKNVSFQLGTVRAVDKENRRLIMEDGPAIPYDYLILAAGSMTNYFGIPGAEEFAFPMKTVTAALHIRNHVLRQFERAERDPEWAGEGALNVVIVGGGPTGVELAGQFAELFHKVLKDDFRRIDPRKGRVILVEALPGLLTAFDKDLGDYARRVLEERGVEIRTDTTVERVTYDAVHLKGGERIPANTLIWAAGVRAHPIAETVGTPQGKGGRLITENDLSLPGHPEIFAIGDINGLMDPQGRPYPQLATVAIQQGEHAARQIRRRLQGQPTEPFAYDDPGTMATIGRNAAIVQLPGGLKFKGFVAWLMWALIHIYKISGFRNRVDVFANWVYSYVTYDFSARLIMDVVPIRAAKKIEEAYAGHSGITISNGDGREVKPPEPTRV